MAQLVYLDDGSPVAPDDLAKLTPAPGVLRQAADVAAQALSTFPGMPDLGPPTTPAGRQAYGVREAGRAMATGLVGTPGGYAAQVGSLPYHVVRNMSPYATEDPWQAARGTRHAVERAVQYVPETPEGQAALRAMAENAFVNPRLTQAAAAAAQRFGEGGPEAPWWQPRGAGEELGDLAGTVVHPLNVAPLAAPLMRGARAGFARAAETTALRTLGAPAKVAELMERR